jgi:hypothetical protein
MRPSHAAAALGLVLLAKWCGSAQETPDTLVYQTTPTMLVRDGFEGKELSRAWAHDRFTESAVAIQSKVVRAGHQALAITVLSRDTFEAGQNGNSDSERDELREATPLISRENMPYEFSFSMFFLRDFPIVPVRLVIAQWKQFCPEGNKLCDDQSPVLALRYIDGELQVTQDLEHKQIFLFRQKAEFRGRWLDFRIRARFTPHADGHEQVWLNGKQIVDYIGVTADQVGSATGYPDPSYFYFKMGLYRDVMQQPMTVYIDEYSKRELKHDEF